MFCSIQTDIELPHFGRLPIRVLVCDPLGGSAQGSHTEHSVNLGKLKVLTEKSKTHYDIFRLNYGRFLLNSRGISDPSTQFSFISFYV